jgi:hypothetical protein
MMIMARALSGETSLNPGVQRCGFVYLTRRPRFGLLRRAAYAVRKMDSVPEWRRMRPSTSSEIGRGPGQLMRHEIRI